MLVEFKDHMGKLVSFEPNEVVRIAEQEPNLTKIQLRDGSFYRIQLPYQEVKATVATAKAMANG